MSGSYDGWERGNYEIRGRREKGSQATVCESLIKHFRGVRAFRS